MLARDPQLWLSRSWTTRARRRDEPAGWYEHVERAAFEARVAAGGFLEWQEFLGELYGTPTPDPPAGRDLVLEIELDGARQVKARYPDAVMVFVVPPSRAVQEERMRRRGDPEDRIRARLEVADDLDRVGRAMADHVVVNDDLDRAVEEVAGIVGAHRSSPSGDRR